MKSHTEQLIRILSTPDRYDDRYDENTPHTPAHTHTLTYTHTLTDTNIARQTMDIISCLIEASGSLPTRYPFGGVEKALARMQTASGDLLYPIQLTAMNIRTG
ncbi:unnamed protein product [Nippostrongylus brasiliensis]|uniref:Tail protein n=1 Tax=Nippostrongylus brasiliensis TaxID=27835 RepID=A0A0N4XGK0_NIPBR|nr:unnamed protein product [Nippostrongylus brasiliensis]